jgi:CRISPR/Cas system-associated exonuclease Cas4 (RecB family)
MGEQAPIVRASELSQYAFCRKAWWLAVVQGEQPDDLESLERGASFHRQHQGVVRQARRKRQLGLALMAGGAVLFLIVLFGSLVASVG